MLSAAESGRRKHKKTTCYAIACRMEYSAGKLWRHIIPVLPQLTVCFF